MTKGRGAERLAPRTPYCTEHSWKLSAEALNFCRRRRSMASIMSTAFALIRPVLEEGSLDLPPGRAAMVSRRSAQA